MNYGDPKVSLSDLTGGSICETIDISNFVNNNQSCSSDSEEENEEYEDSKEHNSKQGTNPIDYDKYLFVPLSSDSGSNGLSSSEPTSLLNSFSSLDDMDCRKYNLSHSFRDLDLLWHFIVRSLSMNSLINTSFDSEKINGKLFMANGLQANHTYSLLYAVEFKYGMKF
jgi:hypothetical protein